MSQQIEMIVATYGTPYGAVTLKRETAAKLADGLLGLIIDRRTDLTTPFIRGIGLNPCIVDLSYPRYRIVSTRLEDDPTDPYKGIVIAVCQEIQRLGPQEVK